MVISTVSHQSFGLLLNFLLCSLGQLRVDLLKRLQISETELDAFFGLKDQLKAVKLSEPSDRAIVYTNGDEPFFFDATGSSSHFMQQSRFHPYEQERGTSSRRFTLLGAALRCFPRSPSKPRSANSSLAGRTSSCLESLSALTEGYPRPTPCRTLSAAP